MFFSIVVLPKKEIHTIQHCPHQGFCWTASMHFPSWGWPRVCWTAGLWALVVITSFLPGQCCAQLLHLANKYKWLCLAPGFLFSGILRHNFLTAPRCSLSLKGLWRHLPRFRPIRYLVSEDSLGSPRQDLNSSMYINICRLLQHWSTVPKPETYLRLLLPRGIFGRRSNIRSHQTPGQCYKFQHI